VERAELNGLDELDEFALVAEEQVEEIEEKSGK
jgi:hypothetical protein